MKSIFKHFLGSITLLLTLNLAACSSSTPVGDLTESELARFITYKTSDFQIEVPEEWETINQFSGQNFPEGIRVAFRNNLKEENDFIANVTVVREDNLKQLTGLDVTQEKLAEHARHLLDYELISQEELLLRVGGGESGTFLNQFKGKNESSGETLEFLQLALSKGNRAWVVTATFDPEEDEFVVERLDKILRSFQVK